MKTMKVIIAALALVLLLGVAVPNLVPLDRGKAELDDCLSMRQPITPDTLISIYGSEQIQIRERDGGRAYYITPSKEYLQVASSGIVAFEPEGEKQFSWLQCTESQFAFGKDQI